LPAFAAFTTGLSVLPVSHVAVLAIYVFAKTYLRYSYRISRQPKILEPYYIIPEYFTQIFNSPVK
jgi:hypothetical protein